MCVLVSSDFQPRHFAKWLSMANFRKLCHVVAQSFAFAVMAGCLLAIVSGRYRSFSSIDTNTGEAKKKVVV